ncbi:MAG: hypothetical protein WD336_06755 [Trueperaceae bacterium]
MTALVQVIRAEWFKMVRKRRTWVLAGLWWGLLPLLTVVVARVLQVNVGGSFLDDAGTTIAGLLQEVASPYGLARIGLTGPAFVTPSFYMIVIALFAATLFGEERSQNMWKTTLVAQPSRLAVLWGKIVTLMALSGLLLAGAAAAGVLWGTIAMTMFPTNFAGDWSRLAGLFALQWIHLLGAATLASLLIFLVRNVALGVVSIFFLPALLEGLHAVWRATIALQPVNQLNVVFQTLHLRQTLEDLPRYFFTVNLYLPARAPARDLIDLFAEGASAEMQGSPFANLFGAGLSLTHSTGVMLGYAVLFGAILTWIFVRRDVD